MPVNKLDGEMTRVNEQRPILVERYRKWLLGELKHPDLPEPPSLESLRGKNLACFCPLDKLCHADVLLELANKESTT
jgi:hypothetical protein